MQLCELSNIFKVCQSAIKFLDIIVNCECKGSFVVFEVYVAGISCHVELIVRGEGEVLHGMKCEQNVSSFA